MRYLVTGGAGFIGSHIVRRLGSRAERGGGRAGQSVRRQPGEHPFGLPPCRGRHQRSAALSRALEGVEVVLHLARFVSIRGSFERPEEDLRDNCHGMLSVFRKAGECGVRRVVFASSMGVYGEPERLPVSEDDPAAPVSPYGLSKLRGEMYGKSLSGKYGYSFIALRYFNTYGAGQTPSDYVGVLTSFIRMALEGRPLTIYGDGEQTRDLVWVEDVAEASVLAARVGSGRGAQHRQRRRGQHQPGGAHDSGMRRRRGGSRAGARGRDSADVRGYFPRPAPARLLPARDAGGAASFHRGLLAPQED